MRIGRLELTRLIEQAQHLEQFEEAVAAAARALPADAAAVIEFLEVPIGGSFDVPPEQAIGYFKAKGLKPSFSYLDMQGEAHDHAFTVAKMMHVDMLAQVRASLDSALANGTPFREWADTITPILQSGGWWGRQKVLDPLTGQEIVAQLGSPWRLETIFRTNMQQAYAAGAWQEIDAQKEIAPYLMYDAVDDLRTRASHAAWDRRVLPVDHPWWSTHYPPNGYNCRCGVIQLSKDELDALGLQPSPSPKDGSYDWTNPRTGEELKIPNGLDPGFVGNSGQSWAWKAKQLAKEKAQALQADMRQAAEKLLQEQTQAQALAAIEAQQAAAKAAADAALKRAQELAKEKAAQWGAAQQLEAIQKGAKDALGTGAQYQIKALQDLKKGAGWAELKPTERLAAVQAKAAELKAQAVLNSALHTYKKAVLAGKVPPPAAVKAFQSLPQAQADALLAKIEAEKAALAKAAADAAAKAAAEAAGLPIKPSVAGAQLQKLADDLEAALAAGDAEEIDSVLGLLKYAKDGPDAEALKAYAMKAKAALQKAPAAPQPSQALAMVDGQPPNPDTMVVVGRKTKGGTEGAFYQDTETGTKWLVKFNGSEDAVRNEVLASKLYSLAGVEAPELHAITIGGRPALASRVVDGIKEVGAKALAGTPSVLDGFAVDAWLANWDVVGLSFDNIVLVGGRAMRIDVGGSLRYRAIGGLKGSAFGPSVGEIETLRGATATQARQVFGAMTREQIEASVERVLAISEADIRAVVQRYGPPDQRTRDDLADLMVARRKDLEQRFPAAAERVRARQAGARPPAEQRVTAAEQQAVEASRVNGYGFATDSDQIEDHQVIVHAFRRADGSEATRGFFKLLPGASKDLQQAIAAQAMDAAPSVNVAGARESVLAAVKSINFRADKGQKYDDATVAKVKAALLQMRQVRAEIAKMKTAAVDSKALALVEAEFKAWDDDLSMVLPQALMKRQAVKLARVFPAGQLPDQLEFATASAGSRPAGLAWRKVTGEYQFNTATFERSFATETASTARVAGAGLRYEATLADGTRVVYFPHDSAVAWAMQGVLKIDVPGRGMQSTERVFGTMSEIGLKAQRATQVDRQHLYLNAYARVSLAGPTRMEARAQFAAIARPGEDGVRAKLELLRKLTGVDVEASEGWRQIDGVRQAFGHGRAYQLRPDLDASKMAQLDKTHVLFHNPQGLGTNAGTGVFERLKTVIEGGGMFASLTDRVRRGVALSGSSVSSDLASGGGDYHFTRIRSRASQAGSTGVYWKTAALRRMDAITYDSDMFGRTTGSTVEMSRLGQDIASFKSVAASTSNETIFKGGMSIFDELDAIVLSSQAEVTAAIKWMQEKGYREWPDGRRLDEVIVTKEQWRGKP